MSYQDSHNQYSIPRPSQYFTPTDAQTSQNYSEHGHIIEDRLPLEGAMHRKRPKYTRSKTGCLTCRSKKIKCDESRPRCARCSHGQRECTWPEPGREQKRRISRAFNNPPPSASSENSTPPQSPTEHSPQMSTFIPHRQSDPYLQLHPIEHGMIKQEQEGAIPIRLNLERRNSTANNYVTMMSEISTGSYAISRYEQTYESEHRPLVESRPRSHHIHQLSSHWPVSSSHHPSADNFHHESHSSSGYRGEEFYPHQLEHNHRGRQPSHEHHVGY